MAAAASGHTAIVELLARLSADVRSVADDGRTAMLLAALNGRTETVRALAALGEDVCCKTKEGLTAVISAAQYGHTQAVLELVLLGADVSAANKDGFTAVMVAAQVFIHDQQNRKAVKQLLMWTFYLFILNHKSTLILMPLAKIADRR